MEGDSGMLRVGSGEASLARHNAGENQSECIGHAPLTIRALACCTLVPGCQMLIRMCPITIENRKSYAVKRTI